MKTHPATEALIEQITQALAAPYEGLLVNIERKGVIDVQIIAGFYMDPTLESRFENVPSKALILVPFDGLSEEQIAAFTKEFAHDGFWARELEDKIQVGYLPYTPNQLLRVLWDVLGLEDTETLRFEVFVD